MRNKKKQHKKRKREEFLQQKPERNKRKKKRKKKGENSFVKRLGIFSTTCRFHKIKLTTLFRLEIQQNP